MANTVPKVKGYVNSKEACEILGVSDVTVWRWAKAKKITAYSIRNGTMFKRDEVERLAKTYNAIKARA